MKKSTQGKGVFDLIEEATHLLRAAPSGLLASYYLGTVPFILGLLYFSADMSRNPFADQHLVEAALGVTLLFLWMKFWQAIFARRVRAHIAAEPASRFDARQALRIAVVQAALQPFGLLPIGLCVAGFFYFTPIGLIFAGIVGITLPFFHNVTALSGGSDIGVRAIFKRAWRLWWLWPKQNFVMLVICYFFGLYVFINWSILCISLPGLIKTLFSIDSVFVRNPYAMLNTTFFMVTFGLTYLCVDPILKTLYALRCFYGDSVKSGEDLKADLKRFSNSPQTFSAAIVLFIVLSGGINLRAADSASAGSQLESPSVASAKNSSSGKPESISAPDLDHAIDQTIHERKFTWRMPRQKVADAGANTGPVGRFFQKISDLLRKWIDAAWEWVGKMLRKLLGHESSESPASSGQGWMTTSQVLLFVLIAVVACALVIFIYRLLRGKRLPTLTASEPIQPVPDLTDENVGADQLPEDGWTRLARELLERGEFRLAMRAFYLASLAHLAQRNLISIARFKSNHDYERELRRRAHSFPDLLMVFGDNLTRFERIWYGLHEVNGETVSQFAENVEKIKAVG